MTGEKLKFKNHGVQRSFHETATTGGALSHLLVVEAFERRGDNADQSARGSPSQEFRPPSGCCRAASQQRVC